MNGDRRSGLRSDRRRYDRNKYTNTNFSWCSPPNVFVPIRTHTQNFEESASIGTSHTAEQYSYEFKVSDQKGRRLRSSSRISRTNRAGAIMAVVSTVVPIGSVVVLSAGGPFGRGPFGLRYGCGCFKVSRRESYL